MSKNPPLRRTRTIEVVDEDFATPNRREAANEILQFYKEGIRTFTEMEERGSWSRSLYQKVYHEHFAAKTEGGPSKDQLAREALNDGELSPAHRSAYQDGFKDGIEWALKNQQLLRQFADEPTD